MSHPRIPIDYPREQLKFRKEMYLDVFFILCIVSYGVGVSGFFRKFRKPFSCETCMCFWSSLLYIICTGNFNLKGIALCCLCSFLATPFANLLIVTREILNYILIKITPR